MRYALTILTLVVSTLSFGQSLSAIDKRLRLLENSVDFKRDTTGFSSLPAIDYFCDNENQNPSDNYHVADLNSDGLNDLIYSGPCKPSGRTGIFLNTGRGFKRIHNYPGKLISVDKKPASTVIHILKTACCCDYYSEYIAVTIDTASRVFKHTIVFGASTKVKLAPRIRSTKVVGIIRMTPEINDVSKKDSCRNQMIKGNHITRIENFKDVVELNRVGTWWLVLYPQNKERSWIGWMKMSK